MTKVRHEMMSGLRYVIGFDRKHGPVKLYFDKRWTDLPFPLRDFLAAPLSSLDELIQLYDEGYEKDVMNFFSIREVDCVNGSFGPELLRQDN